MYYPFNEQRGAYKVLMRNRFIFVKNDLHPVMENIVLLHEFTPGVSHESRGLQRVSDLQYAGQPYGIRSQSLCRTDFPIR
mgnify:CR=1 FL=1